jgi:hypothetical protein
MSGAIQEMLAHLENPECSGPGCDTRGGNTHAWTVLEQARAEYRRGLDLDREAGEARLRLGRVLFLQNRRTQAREELETVIRTSTNIRLLYLAHLFLGGIDDSESDFTHARLEYEAALKLAPGFQTSYIALSFAELMNAAASPARRTRARRPPKPADADPWLAQAAPRLRVAALVARGFSDDSRARRRGAGRIGAVTPQQTTFKSGVEAVRLDVSVMRGVAGARLGRRFQRHRQGAQRVGGRRLLPQRVPGARPVEAWPARSCRTSSTLEDTQQRTHPDDRAALITGGSRACR